MTSRLPRARRVGAADSRVMYALVGVAAVLIIAIGTILFGGPLFDNTPKTDTERDYDVLLKALSRDPKNVAVLMTLAETEYRLGKKTEALDHAKQGAELATSTAGIPMRYAQLLVQEGKLADAQKWTEADLKLRKSNDSEPRFLLAQILHDRGKTKEALAQMERGLKVSYQAADMRIVYAEMLADAGKKKDAEKQFREALRYLPDNERALKGLKDLGVSAEQTGTVESPHS